MTSKKLLVYYSMTGNTKAMIPFFEALNFDLIDIRKVDSIDFEPYEFIAFGTSTWGRGLPPKPFFKLRDDIVKIKGKSIGLFGSGRSEYEFFCGALDLLEELLQSGNNKIVFKYKYEGYPREIDFGNMKKNIKNLEELL